ncbi:DNA cytosine methyltransferase [Herbaspirillum sp. SJZ099]|uniref:DNA cytosine methyltransferase n=1 Tax=Herbaspirillum sp. SJZ099 TaxID=2572916 RepID=UPI0011A14B65|nr:DNA cytosine methyltransferase [Herbaspirillum sp. SJZ099]TWC72007.1 DNA (cytosine-5)-methyltransferase 1 [Herbaspirillum sp. SJZ099]
MRTKDYQVNSVTGSRKKKSEVKTSSVGETSAAKPQIISLFSGAGGMDLGFKDAGFKVAVAIDLAPAAIKSHKRNFPRTKSIVGDLEKLQPAGVLAHALAAIPSGSKVAVIGGPPCQGFSRANNNSQADDPRNTLPKLYLEIVRELQEHYVVEFIVLENVLGIRDKKHSETYAALVNGIRALGFDVTEKELCAIDYGVPQNRKRVILSGLRSGQGYSIVRPRKSKGLANVREAIGHLCEPAYFAHKLEVDDIPHHPNHWTMRPRSDRFSNPSNEDDGNGRSFKRLKWDLASPTVAYGHREIHVHPNGHRRLSVHEAMLLQGFPETFVLEGNLSEQVEQISNAVPPPLARSVANAVARALNKR